MSWTMSLVLAAVLATGLMGAPALADAKRDQIIEAFYTDHARDRDYWRWKENRRAWRDDDYSRWYRSRLRHFETDPRAINAFEPSPSADSIRGFQVY